MVKVHGHGQAEAKLEELNILLDSPPKPSGNYVPYTILPPLIYLSGVTPKVGGVLQYKGKVGQELSKEEGYQAARQCMINQLSTLKSVLGDLSRVTGIVKMEGFIHVDPQFCDLPYVLNGASDLLVEVFGDKGLHARSAIGVASLPGGAAVEVELIVSYE
ncbi:RidA family protein [Paenibacillus alginolyticus]|uniref:RidA family protein n=1 Tax=Paenibacillus alginolyticus TaxID=59839 RepID=A0ABT4GMB7_9BACL|nr:RidA family protein [Paenibacillus alginolyticus]MCY9697143.1 RidA family protein [Paenibacillus alginolyticus]MEC0148370.1 RidA family protein [Paenibacillus alginolyticus]